MSARGTQQSGNSLKQVYALALRGDVSAALASLQKLDDRDLSEHEATIKARFAERFVAKDEQLPSTADPRLDSLLSGYRRYWSSSMLREVLAETAEKQLFADLVGWTAASAKPNDVIAELAEQCRAVQALLVQWGYHSITGITRPYYELMVWRSEAQNEFEVELPESVQSVRVVFMDDFVCLGWTAFATLGRHYSAGWATSDGLYCVKQAYDIDSEAFQVSFLVHEAQHFSDYGRFPGLEQPELEYRAKLAELSRARTTVYSLIDRFVSNRTPTRDNPHAYAQHHVVNDLSQAIFDEPFAELDHRFRAVSHERINHVASSLLKADSSQHT